MCTGGRRFCRVDGQQCRGHSGADCRSQLGDLAGALLGTQGPLQDRQAVKPSYQDTETDSISHMLSVL